MTDLGTYVQNLQPVFITAPTARNGVTLVQRLLNSSKQIIVYGENTDFMSVLPKLVHSTVKVHTDQSEIFAHARKQFFEQTTEGWTSNLWPDPQIFMVLAFEAFNKAAAAYQQSSEQYGYQRWGIKNPSDQPQMIKRLKILMPNAKFVFIYRHLLDVVRSAKSRAFIKDDAGLAKYATQWKDILTAVVNAKHSNVWILPYEKLIESPDAMIDQLQQFTGINNIDATVMQRKFNTFQTTDPKIEGTNKNGYIKPQPLSKAEIKIVTDIAGKTMQQFGYEIK